MEQIFNYLGFLGTILVAIAYVPQISHLIKENCSYGISLKAWALWCVATLFMLPHALETKSGVFISLLFLQLVLSVLVLIFSYSRKNNVCFSHSLEKK